MPWCGFLFRLIICLIVQYFVSTSSKISRLKPTSVGVNLESNNSYLRREVRMKESIAENVTIAHMTSDVSTTSALPQILSNFTQSDAAYNSTYNLPSWMIPIKSGALQRTGFVVLGLISIILLFFVVRSVRVHQKKGRKKYGLLTSTDLEMVPLDKEDEEEEDMTLFDVKHKFLK